jgi:rhomboid family GlyGly-CTERM serine protease
MDITRRLPWLTLGLAVIASALLAFPEAASALELNRTAFQQAQLWRIWTGHLTHYGLSHGAWDVAVLVALGGTVESGWFGVAPLGRRSLALLWLWSGAAISVAVVVLEPALDRYRGLSGIDSALYAWLCAALLQRGMHHRSPAAVALSLLALIGFVGKSLFEQVQSSTLFVDSAHAGFQPVPIAHLVGAVVGLLGVALSARPTSTSLHSRRIRDTPGDPGGIAYFS